MHPPTTAAPGGPGHVGAGASSACSYCQRTSGSLWFKATPARAGPAVAATRPLVTAIVVKRRRILCFMTVHLLSHPSPRALLAVTASAARCGSGSCRPGPVRRILRFILHLLVRSVGRSHIGRLFGRESITRNS